MQRLSTGLIATFTALTISLPLKAETDPCSRAYAISAAVMTARQHDIPLPQVLETTNALVNAISENQRAGVETTLRSIIVSAYRISKTEAALSSADEFGNGYGLNCLTGEDRRFPAITWDQQTINAFDMWATVMGSGIDSGSDHSEPQKKENELGYAFARAEDEARRQWELKKNEEAELVAAKTLDAMTTRITRAWQRPVAFKGGLDVYLRMSLASNGELVDVRIVKTSGDVLFDRSAVTAVKRAAPFDEVTQFDEATFEEKFRSFTVKFRPED